MSARQVLFYLGALLLFGAGWGLTMPLTKIAVSTGYQHFGLLFWQMAIGFLTMSLIGLARGKGLPLSRSALWVYFAIAMIGSVVPNSFSYQAAVHLPSGVLSILLSMIPMFAFPMALALGLDRFELRRFGGLVAGLFGVSLIVLPNLQLGSAIPVIWVGIALISGLCYAFEGNYVARWGTAGLDPVEVLWGASLVGMIITFPLAIGAGQWITPLQPYGQPEWAHIASSVIHVLVYTGYVWLVNAAGPVFAVMISYLVTVTGVFWARAILDESYPPTVWAALALMLIGMALVQPRRLQRAVP
ncbi:MAG: DMT family transporter [Pseudomonadota bacterium]